MKNALKAELQKIKTALPVNPIAESKKNVVALEQHNKKVLQNENNTNRADILFDAIKQQLNESAEQHWGMWQHRVDANKNQSNSEAYVEWLTLMYVIVMDYLNFSTAVYSKLNTLPIFSIRLNLAFLAKMFPKLTTPVALVTNNLSALPSAQDVETLRLTPNVKYNVYINKKGHIITDAELNVTRNDGRKDDTQDTLTLTQKEKTSLDRYFIEWAKQQGYVLQTDPNNPKKNCFLVDATGTAINQENLTALKHGSHDFYEWLKQQPLDIDVEEGEDIINHAPLPQM